MSLRGCLSRLPLRRPLTRRPCVRACCWFALLLLVLQIVLPVGAGRAAAEERGGSSQNRKKMWSANGKRTGKHPCARQDLAAARRARELLDLAAYLQKQLLGLDDSSSEKAKEVKQELNEAKKELREANREVDKATQEVEKASASVQAGRVRAGASACAVVAVAFDLHSRMVVVRFRGGPPLLLFGVVLSSRQGSPRRQSCLHCVHWGLFGVEGLLAASGFTKKCGCTCFTAGKGTFVAQAKVLRKSDLHSCFADASERGVNPRLELGGVSFALALTGCWCWQ